MDKYFSKLNNYLFSIINKNEIIITNFSGENSQFIRFNNSKIPENVIFNILAFMMLYVVIFSIGSIIMTLLGVDFMTAIGSVAASLGNVGPGIGSVGPDASYSNIPIAGKWFLSLLMFIGRLELFTFLLILTPAFWKHN